MSLAKAAMLRDKPAEAAQQLRVNQALRSDVAELWAYHEAVKSGEGTAWMDNRVDNMARDAALTYYNVRQHPEHVPLVKAASAIASTPGHYHTFGPGAKEHLKKHQHGEDAKWAWHAAFKREGDTVTRSVGGKKMRITHHVPDTHRPVWNRKPLPKDTRERTHWELVGKKEKKASLAEEASKRQQAKERQLQKAASGPVRLHTDPLYRPSLPKKKSTPFAASVPQYHQSPTAAFGDATVRSLADIGADIMVGQGGANFFSQYR